MTKTGFVYKLTNSENDLYYIGSTTTSLKERLYGHLKDSQNIKRKSPLVCMIRELGKDKLNIVELKKIEFRDIKELKENESSFINLGDKNCLNKKLAHGFFTGVTSLTDKHKSWSTRYADSVNILKNDNPDIYEELKEKSRSKANKKRAEEIKSNPEMVKERDKIFRTKRIERLSKDPEKLKEFRQKCSEYAKNARLRKLENPETREKYYEDKKKYGKNEWEKIKADPVKHEENKRKKRERYRMKKVASEVPTSDVRVSVGNDGLPDQSQFNV